MTSNPVVVSPPSNPPDRFEVEASFVQLTSNALRVFQSTLALSRSSLANSALVTPTLVKDQASATAEERGHGLRLLLLWAVEQLAPAPPAFPFGAYRPLDDPTWRDPRWWRYNILRHRYLEPLHPDDFVDGGRYTESLLALTGISSQDAFFDERNRAIRAVAEVLQRQLRDGHATPELQQLALHEAMLPLERQPEIAHLLAIAATFEEIFPRTLLFELADDERIDRPPQVLDALIRQRFLLTGDDEASLWLSPVVRAYVYGRQPKEARQRRHRLAANFWEAEGDLLAAARHWQLAGHDARAARLLLPAADELVHELQARELIELLRLLDGRRLSAEQRYAVHLLLADLWQRTGQPDEALAACRHALQAATEPAAQARVYRRMGKLYESRNHLHALRYYQQAIERFPADDPEVAELLKDRGWVYSLREEWSHAEADLRRALAHAPLAARTLRGDIYDAMASLYRKTGNHEQAVALADRALALREEEGDLLRLAKSHGNLGLIYRAMGEFDHAIAAYQEALAAYVKLGNQELVAVALLNSGAACFHGRRHAEALAAYSQSLAISSTLGLPLLEMKAYFNLAEALNTLGRHEAAAAQWEEGFQICTQHGFDDQVEDFRRLGATIPTLAVPAAPPAVADGEALPAAPAANLTEDEEFVLALARRERTLTPKRLMQAASVSRATATRRLTALAEKGLLQVEGKGRGVVYRPVAALPQPPAPVAPAANPGNDRSMNAALAAHRDTLRTRFGVTAMGRSTQTGPSGLRLVAHFHPMPDLATYFALRQYVGHLLGSAVDVVLEEPGEGRVAWWWNLYSSVTQPSDADETDL